MSGRDVSRRSIDSSIWCDERIDFLQGRYHYGGDRRRALVPLRRAVMGRRVENGVARGSEYTPIPGYLGRLCHLTPHRSRADQPPHLPIPAQPNRTTTGRRRATARRTWVGPRPPCPSPPSPGDRPPHRRRGRTLTLRADGPLAGLPCRGPGRGGAAPLAAALTDRRRSKPGPIVENTPLRQGLLVLRRSIKRPRSASIDRTLRGLLADGVRAQHPALPNRPAGHAHAPAPAAVSWHRRRKPRARSTAR